MINILYGIITGVFGRLGGMGGAWWKSSWVRDWLIGPVCCLVAFLNGVNDWWILATIITTAGALSTYWDWLFDDEDNFFMHGLMVGIAAFPIAIATGLWWMFALRCVILCLWMGIWSYIFEWDDAEEFGRYFIVGSTIFMLC